MTKLSVIIPCYRSEHTIEQVVDEVCQTIDSREGYSYEIILVNDSSPDNVYEVIKALAKKNNNITGIDLAKNFGQHAAILTGMRYASGDIIVCLDDDGQTPPSEMFKLVDKIQEGFDVVIAKYASKKHSLFRNLGSKVNDIMARVLIGKPKELSLMSYFCCKKFIVDEMIRYNNSYPYIEGLFLRATNKVTNVPVQHKERLEGESGYSISKLISLWINGFTAFSVKPLRVATFLGLVISLFSLLYGLYVIINKLFINTSSPIGYSSLMVSLTFFGGLILLFLGLIGEYIGRIYISINSAPQSVVRRTTDDEK